MCKLCLTDMKDVLRRAREEINMSKTAQAAPDRSDFEWGRAGLLNGLERTASKENETEKMSNQALHPLMRRLRCRLISQQTERIPWQPYRPRDPAKASRRHLGGTGPCGVEAAVTPGTALTADETKVPGRPE